MGDLGDISLGVGLTYSQKYVERLSVADVDNDGRHYDHVTPLNLRTFAPALYVDFFGDLAPHSPHMHQLGVDLKGGFHKHFQSFSSSVGYKYGYPGYIVTDGKRIVGVVPEIGVMGVMEYNRYNHYNRVQDQVLGGGKVATNFSIVIPSARMAIMLAFNTDFLTDGKELYTNFDTRLGVKFYFDVPRDGDQGDVDLDAGRAHEDMDAVRNLLNPRWIDDKAAELGSYDDESYEEPEHILRFNALHIAFDWFNTRKPERRTNYVAVALHMPSLANYIDTMKAAGTESEGFRLVVKAYDTVLNHLKDEVDKYLSGLKDPEAAVARGDIPGMLQASVSFAIDTWSYFESSIYFSKYARGRLGRWKEKLDSISTRLGIVSFK